ncbi:MAG TPA: PEGA domain-containing protein [Candidatus Sulfotelmatobacter sp.]|nr:PEGA domain-containing protein [Candidatus Sulfotelmatobacter sp.]
MSTKIGHFEILSELAKSPTGVVYKANDAETGQTIALKAIQLSAFGESAGALQQALLDEAECTKVLSSPNITNVYGAGEVEGQFCAPMEYVQGNSIATMLARKEGFSIWDLLDIGRQLCQGFEHASAHNIVHRSLEPSKIMCGWDGTVKILSFGISSVGDFVQHVGGDVSSILYYMSPEQIRGEAMDARSNLFSLGAMFYEMVTDRKAFDREDVESLRQSILESTPVAPIHVNPKVHPLLSDLIMKSIAKDPAERFQTGRELLDEMEKCKESKSVAAKKPEAPKSPVSNQVKAAAQSKFVNASAPKPGAPASPKPAAQMTQAKAAPAKPIEKKLAAPVTSTPARPEKKVTAIAKTAPKAAAAAAGAGSRTVSSTPREAPELDLSDAYVAAPVGPTVEAVVTESAYMSSAVADEPQVETFEPQANEGPKIAVDPMMAEGGSSGGSSTSFSEISELPPLKETYVAPAPPAATHFQPEDPVATYTSMLKGKQVEEKPKVQPREVAQKAIKEIKGVPPKLMLYSIGGAVALILAIGIGVTIYIHSIGSDDDAGARRPAPTVTQEQVEPQPAQKQVAPAPVQSQPEEEASEPVEKSAAPSKARAPKKKAAAVAPAIVAGQLSIDSTPQGAQIQINGKSDASWVTPLAMTDLQPGQYSITVSKAGYVTDTRTLDVTSGGRASANVHLVPLTATLIVKSDPHGANIYVDGHDLGAKTPAQVSIPKGEHVVLVRMSGYIDETMNAQFVLGQTYNFSPTLRALGNVDNIKTVGGKMSKLFGGGKADPGQATVSIHTQPKGAQVAINKHMIDKSSPVDVAVDPGNYEVDITLSGYAPLHKVISADKKGKVVIDEVLQPQ